jgi:hypothetical protein
MLLKVVSKPMIDTGDLNSALQTAKPLFNELQNQYENLPPTQCRCQKPGVCCAYLPQMTLMEALQWVDILQQLPDSKRIDTLRLFMRFYLKNSKRRIIRTSVFG